MRIVKPEVHLIAETRIIEDGLTNFLTSVGAPEWTTDAPSDCEKLMEVAGRSCYRSWKPGLNPNVTRVREGNRPYLGHIIETEHGSVMEHAQITWVFHNVSRVFTHELVRHRIAGISQESLRYVRLTDLGVSIPKCFEGRPNAERIMKETVLFLEEKQVELAEEFDIENTKDFDLKKKWTSAFRRIAPIGLATTIIWSSNFRTLRFVIRQRTNSSAEEEIRIVFGEVYKIAKQRYPNIFQDYEEKTVDGLLEVNSPHAKA